LRNQKKSLNKVDIKNCLSSVTAALMELVKQMNSTRGPVSEVKTTSITLPKLDPDSAGADSSAWCNTVELIFVEHMLTESERKGIVRSTICRN